ncbi:hypothetical protein IPV69_13160 [Humisphaera borealis]|uniref:Uncharacterized protein n=1 Tax=Humisphaera borealis TaxID=2807512 RepID=A0A7M2X4R5_9BACT|nr:hypothetical protein IPV69_13160 [Humisphaera borealis]
MPRQWSVAADAGKPADASKAVEQAHAETWRRFIDKHGVMVDFTDLDGSINLPTPEECREGKPNALGWYQPIENGAMFNGMYLDAAVLRWQESGSADDAAKARRLMEGLLFLNSISDVKGFVGRGVSSDGKSHYPMGSNDQTMPWYFGLWRYLESGLATKDERQRIVAKLVETTGVIERLGWKMPAEQPFGTRGSFAGFTFDTAPRQLFVLKLLHRVTGDDAWEEKYRRAIDERGGKEKQSRLEICRKGMVFDYARTHNWTSCTAVSAIRGLWEMESDPALKADYVTGLKASAALASESLAIGTQFDHRDPSTFSQDWRKAMMPLWKPQKTEQEAQELANAQLREFMKISPRRQKETAWVREPTSAAWIVTLCPDAQTVRAHAEVIERIIAHYDYSKLYYCTFFWVEAAWRRLKALPR